MLHVFRNIEKMRRNILGTIPSDASTTLKANDAYLCESGCGGVKHEIKLSYHTLKTAHNCSNDNYSHIGKRLKLVQLWPVMLIPS